RCRRNANLKSGFEPLRSSVRPTRVHNFGTYFVGAQTAERRGLFQNGWIAELFIETLYHYRRQSRYLLHDFVVMPDHVHAILTPAETLERSMQLIKGGFSFRLREKRPNLEVWQKGFTDHRIRDDQDFAIHRVYVRMNPVKAQLCARPEEYPYSSAS